MALFETAGLTKNFGGLRALDGLDLRVEEGEIVGLIGPNGSGKTTVFNVITGIHRATAGRFTFDHGRRDLTALPSHAITAVGIARTFQNQRLFGRMTVLENVLVGMHCRTHAGIAGILLGTPGTRAEKRQARERGMELLALFGERLLPRAEHQAWTLSYANRRRLEIARALGTAPRLLLLDEPAAGMNPTETQQLMGDIQRIRDRGTAILLIEHDMRVVRGICERVVALDHGLKIAEGTFEEVRENPALLEAYLGRRGAGGSVSGRRHLLRLPAGPQGRHAGSAPGRDRVPARRQRVGEVHDDEGDPRDGSADRGPGGVRRAADRSTPDRDGRAARDLARARSAPD